MASAATGGSGAAAAAAAYVAGRLLKTKVPSNMGAPHVRRFYNTIWSYRVGQLSTSAMNVSPMTTMTMGGRGSGGRGTGDSNNGDADKDAALPVAVHSDLQPYALHKFSSDKKWSLVVAVSRSSRHCRNVRTCTKASFMTGHTDPQLFHWFKQLGAVPPRALLSGAVDVLGGDALAEVWDETLVRHPVLHSMAQEQWESDANLSDADRAHFAQRQREEDDKRMRRMSSSDWRAKFRDRERDPTAREDEEMPVYMLKADEFAVLRLRPDARVWFGVAGQTQRVWETEVPEPDPLYRCAPRIMTMLNASRAKLVASLNINYEMRLTNAFVYAIDEAGLWALGTEDNVAERNGVVNESWSELRIEFGKNQRLHSEQELEWWVQGLMRFGEPETGQMSNSVADAAEQSHSDYRHT